MAGALAVRVRTEVMRRRLKNALQGSRVGRTEGLRLIGGEIIRNIYASAPMDTRRFVRGWLIAGKAAGVYRGMLPPLRKTRYFDTYIATLEKWVATCRRNLVGTEATIALLFPNGAPRSAGRGLWPKLQQRRKMWQKRLDQAIVQLEEARNDPYVLVIGGGKVFTDERTGEIVQATHSKGKQLRPTIRTKIYGGTGSLVESRDRTSLHLHNLEAHASIIEAKKRVFANASAAARAGGARLLKKSHIAALRKAGGASRVLE